MYQDYELELFCGKMIELFEEEYISALQKVGNVPLCSIGFF